MKLGKILYFTAVFVMATVGGIMIQNGWFIFGGFMGFCSVASIIFYIDTQKINRTYQLKSKKGRRAAYFKSLTSEEQEEYLINIEKQLEKSIKNKKSL
jgi:hypothetical protein